METIQSLKDATMEKLEWGHELSVFLVDEMDRIAAGETTAAELSARLDTLQHDLTPRRIKFIRAAKLLAEKVEAVRMEGMSSPGLR